jgi:riboflavin kinase/FMN adenylyltransferase
MKVISLNGTSKLHLKRTCAAIGIFDGVHRGHQYLIQQMLAAARRLHAQPIVITFFPHPAHVLRPDVKLGYLTSLEERFRRLNGLGVAVCVVVPFNRSFAKIEPQKFIKDILVQKLGVKAVFVGQDFRFGKDRSGDVVLFERLGLEYGFEMHPVPAVKQGRKIISSTLIRQMIGEGKFNEAYKFLGRAVSVSGIVVKGAQRGRDLGFPTANIAYESDVIPPQGVYVVEIILGKMKYPAMANIGTRPSFEKQKVKLHLEVHILDFARNIYGKQVEVEFVKKIRNEKKFASIQDLIKQIKKDEIFTRRYLSS